MSLPDKGKKFGSTIPGEEPIQRKPKGSGKKFGSTLPSNKKGRRSKLIRNRSIAQEERLADKLGGYRVPGSGALRGGAHENDLTGDVNVYIQGLTTVGNLMSNGFKIEAKSTKKSSFSISKKLIEKTHEEAVADGMNMALAIELLGLQDEQLPDKYVVLTEDCFAKLLELAIQADQDDEESE